MMIIILCNALHCTTPFLGTPASCGEIIEKVGQIYAKARQNLNECTRAAKVCMNMCAQAHEQCF